MTQNTLPTIDPAVDTGTSLAGFLNAWRPAVVSQNSGPTRPTYAVPGTIWYDTDVNKPFYFNGSADIGFAVSSDLVGYLPLAGGTLTGPLGGTTAQFSGTLAIAGAISGTAKLTVNGSVNLKGTGTRLLSFVDNGDVVQGGIAQTDTDTTLFAGVNAATGLKVFPTGAVAGVAEIKGGVLRASLVAVPASGELFLGNGIFKFTHTGNGFVSWNGAIVGTSVYVNGGSYFYEPTGAVVSGWNGSAIAFSHPLTAPGYPSDSRLKKNVSTIPPLAVSVVDAVQPCTFVYKSDDENTTHLGFLADDFVNTLPMAVNRYSGTGEAPTDLMALDPMALIAQLWLELRDVRARLAILETPI